MPSRFLQPLIEQQGLSWEVFLHSAKGYEQPKGSPELRRAIAIWYQQHYGLTLDPEREIMITHGGVAAINLVIQCTKQEHQGVIISHPSYMLYERAVTALNRPLGESEYHSALGGAWQDTALQQAGVMIINSPENPSGYMLNAQDWDAVAEFTQQHGIWLIHDEVYDVMAYTERHQPVMKQPKMRENTIMINSFSKKFGLPGLRIGWRVAAE